MAGKPRTVKGIFPYRDGFRTDVSLGVDPATGKRKRLPLYGRTIEEVDRARAAILVKHTRGLPVETNRQTVGQFLVWWLANEVKGSVRPRTFVSYEGTARLHIIPTLGRIQLRKLTPQQVQTLLAERAAATAAPGGRGHPRTPPEEDEAPLAPAPLSPRSVQYIRTVLRIALNHALKLELVGRNVAELVEGPRVPRRRIEPFTADEARRLLAAVAGDELEALYWVALVGLRQGELLGLRWADVDLDEASLTVSQQVQRIDHRLQLVEPKTEASRRPVSLPALVVEALRAHRDRRRFARREGDLIFPSPTGAPLDARHLIRHYKALLVRAGLPERRFHDLRHSTATLLYASGVELLTIKEVLRHTQISTTADIYTHVMPELKRAAADAMDGMLRPTRAADGGQ